MFRVYALEFRFVFLFEKRTEPYMEYGKESIAEENTNLAQELLQSSEFCSEAGRRGAKL